MIDTKLILKMWANSVRVKQFPTVTRPAIYNTELKNRMYLLDEEVYEIEKAMRELHNDKEDLHLIIKDIYIRNKSCNSIARILHCRTDIITKKLSEAEYFLRGLIYNFFKNR